MATRKRSSKKKKSFNPILVVVYGIFCKSTNQVLQVSLSEEDMETELELGEYDDTHFVVKMTIALLV